VLTGDCEAIDPCRTCETLTLATIHFDRWLCR
jgi:hypothetical protein